MKIFIQDNFYIFQPKIGDEGLVYGINQTECRLLIVSSELLPKVRSLVSQLPAVQTIVYVSNAQSVGVSKTDGFPQNISLISLQELEKVGTQSPNIEFQIPREDEPVIIMYTSGTTGTPKAAVATHRQLVNGSAMALLVLVKNLLPEAKKHTYVAYLPLAHVLELTIELFLFYGKLANNKGYELETKPDSIDIIIIELYMVFNIKGIKRYFLLFFTIFPRRYEGGFCMMHG